MSRHLYIVFALLVVIALLVLLIVRLLDLAEEREAHGAYRMSRRQRRVLDRERTLENPKLGKSGWSPTVWRLP